MMPVADHLVIRIPIPAASVRRDCLPPLLDVYTWQRLLELLDPLVGHLGLPDVQVPQVLEAGQLPQPRVADRGAVEIQISQVHQTLELRQALISDLALLQMQLDQTSQRLSVRKPGVCD